MYRKLPQQPPMFGPQHKSFIMQRTICVGHKDQYSRIKAENIRQRDSEQRLLLGCCAQSNKLPSSQEISWLTERMLVCQE